MNNEIFRKKSLDRVKSPENLDDYIHVSNPGVWLLLISVVVLLTGVCVWGVLGHVDSTVSGAVRVENGTAVCYIDEKDIASVQTGMTVRFADCEAVLEKIGEKGEMGYSCTLSLKNKADDGLYEGKVTVNSYKPLSFILN